MILLQTARTRGTTTAWRAFSRLSFTQFKRGFRVLGIETSCDDTCVAVLDVQSTTRDSDAAHQDSCSAATPKVVIGQNIVKRSLELSEPYGGIVPNLVGQFHARNLANVLCQVRDAGGFHGLDLIAVTRGPGIPMCLAGGLNHAKGLSVALNVPLIGVHHMQAHALTPRLLSANRTPQFPFYTLLISGGHTLLVHSTSVISHSILINTRDTAVGDYLDKIARILNVPWGNKMPGHALEQWSRINEVDSTAMREDIERWQLPRPLSVYKKNVPAFSFTGLRTAVEKIFLERSGGEMTEDERKSLGRAAQMLVFEHVAQKCVLGIKMTNDGKGASGNLVVSGGVACNMALRKILRRTLDESGLQEFNVIFPPMEFCTDNAAMIAWAGYEMYQEGYLSDFGITQRGKWPLDQLMDEDVGWKRHSDTIGKGRTL